MTKSDFIDWKRHPVTQQVFSQLTERINYMTQTLIETAGKDPIGDSKLSGGIQAYRDMIDIEFEDGNS